jgi:hypothetical protein
MSGQPDRWIEWTTTGCVALPALIAGTVQIADFVRLPMREIDAAPACR